MTFTEFVESATSSLGAVGGKVMQRRESDPEPGCWWLTFRRAAVLYRFRYDRGVAAIFFEKEQGSFVANSPSKWQLLDCREPGDSALEVALVILHELAHRRWGAGRG